MFFHDQSGKLWNRSKGEFHVKVAKLKASFNPSQKILGEEECRIIFEINPGVVLKLDNLEILCL